MRTDKFTYAQVESALYKAMRTLVKKGEVDASLFMKNQQRAERAIEYALEKIGEAEMEPD